jgi:hypothetical protein
LTHPKHVYFEFHDFGCTNSPLDGFEIHAHWTKAPWEREQLLYLLVTSGVYVNGCTETVMFGGSPDSPPDDDSVQCHRVGLFVRGKRAEGPAGERIWIYLPGTPNDVRAIPWTAGPEANLTSSDFHQLGNLPFWKEKLRPRLVHELANFCKEYQEKRRRNPTRYPELYYSRHHGLDLRPELEAYGVERIKELPPRAIRALD